MTDTERISSYTVPSYCLTTRHESAPISLPPVLHKPLSPSCEIIQDHSDLNKKMTETLFSLIRTSYQRRKLPTCIKNPTNV